MVTIVEIPPLSDVDDPNGWAVLAENGLWSAELRRAFGYDDLNNSDTAALRVAVPSSRTRRQRWVAMLDPSDRDSLVGAASVTFALLDNTDVATFDVIVAPEQRRRGIGTALLAALQQWVRSQGRHTLQTWVTPPGQVAEDAPGALRPAEGSGAVPADAASTRFMLANGFTLEQVEVHSVLRVPVAPAVFDPLEADAVAHAGGYRLVTWQGGCPDEYVDDFAKLRVAMVDAPSAGMDISEEHWDADAIREIEQRVREAGYVTMTTAAQHEASGELVGFTQLQRMTERPASGLQEDTVVVGPHRGHRLGMLLKTANLRRLAREWPQVRRIHTWNADENDYMRSINIALGFRPESSEGAWQKHL